jgi:hypothetical protein
LPESYRWTSNVPAVQARVTAATRIALDTGSRVLLEEANRTAPIEEGTLIRSGGTEVRDNEGAIYYDTPYAARQHEEMGWRHDEGRRAKWLELTIREQGERVLDAVGLAMRRGLQ